MTVGCVTLWATPTTPARVSAFVVEEATVLHARDALTALLAIALGSLLGAVLGWLGTDGVDVDI